MKESREHLPLYPDEETIAIEIMGARRAKDWPEKARYLEDKHGLPRVDELMGGRFWPAVVEFFRVRHGMRLREGLDAGEGDAPSLKQSPSIRIVPFKADGKEQFDGPETSPTNDRRGRGRDTGKGFRIITRDDDEREVWWYAAKRAVKRGFHPKTIRLYGGLDSLSDVQKMFDR